MILVDTSVWIEHLRRGSPDLVAALDRGEVATHPFVIGELACGNLRKRAEILSLLRALPRAPVATFDEVLQFIDRRRLMARGLGYVDAHLLASATLDSEITLWTRDKRLYRVAEELEIVFR